jgi:hypothetical protein
MATSPKHDPVLMRMLTAILNRDVSVVKDLLADGYDVDRPLFSAKGQAALHHLLEAHPNEEKLLDVLLEGGANVNLFADDIETPLMIAVRKAHNRRVLEKLVDAGADVFVKKDDGKTLLHMAAMCGNQVGQVGKARPERFDPDVCRFLLEVGVDLFALTKASASPLNRAFTALHVAGCVPAWDFFVGAGISPNYVPDGARKSYLTPAHNLVTWREFDLVRHAFDQGQLDVNERTMAGKDLLSITGSSQMTPLLLSLRASAAVGVALSDEQVGHGPARSGFVSL